MNNVEQLLSPQAALEHYGIDWGIGSSPVQWTPPDITVPTSGEMGWRNYEAQDLPNRVMYRKDTGKPLGIVSDRYTPLDNQAFAGAVSSILGDASDTIVAGGAYRGGKSVWLSADLGTVNIGGVDPVARYATFYTAHDGTGGLNMTSNEERIQCANQFGAMDKSNSIRIRHVGDALHFGIERARAMLTGILAWHDTVEELSNDLAGQSVNAEWLAEYFRRSYVQGMPSATRTLLSTPVTRDMPLEDVAKRERAEARLESHIKTMAGNYSEGMRNKTYAGKFYTEGSHYMPDDIRGSKWHAFNAYTHYIDHDSNRGAESIHIGAAAQLKQTALNLAGSL